eukprot:gene2980-3655_t
MSAPQDNVKSIGHNIDGSYVYHGGVDRVPNRNRGVGGQRGDTVGSLNRSDGYRYSRRGESGAVAVRERYRGSRFGEVGHLSQRSALLSPSVRYESLVDRVLLKCWKRTSHLNRLAENVVMGVYAAQRRALSLWETHKGAVATPPEGLVEVDDSRASVRAGSGHSEALEKGIEPLPPPHGTAQPTLPPQYEDATPKESYFQRFQAALGGPRMDAVVTTFLRRRALLAWIQQSLSERQRVRRLFLRRCGTPLDLSPIRLSASTLRYIRVIAHYCAPLVRLLGRRVSTKRQVANHILKMSKTVSRCAIVAWKDHVECARRSRALADNAVRNALIAAKEKLWRRWRARTKNRNRTLDNSNERSVVSVVHGGPSGEHCSGTGSARRIHLRGLNRRTGSDQRKGALTEALERHRWYSFKLRVYRGRLAIASRHYTARVLTVAIRQFRVYCGRHSLGSRYGALRWRVQLPTGGTAPDLITDREDLGHSYTRTTRSEVLDSPPRPTSTKPLDIIPSLKNNDVNRTLDGTTFLDTPHPDTQAL